MNRAFQVIVAGSLAFVMPQQTLTPEGDLMRSAVTAVHQRFAAKSSGVLKIDPHLLERGPRLAGSVAVNAPLYTQSLLSCLNIPSVSEAVTWERAQRCASSAPDDCMKT